MADPYYPYTTPAATDGGTLWFSLLLQISNNFCPFSIPSHKHVELQNRTSFTCFNHWFSSAVSFL